MKNIFKITLLASALTLPQASGSAWGQQIDLNGLWDDMKSLTQTACKTSVAGEAMCDTIVLVGEEAMNKVVKPVGQALYEASVFFGGASTRTWNTLSNSMQVCTIFDEMAKDYKPTVEISSKNQYNHKNAQILLNLKHPVTLLKVGLSSFLQDPVSKALKGLEFSEACSGVASNLLTSFGALGKVSYVAQNMGTINKCIQNTYAYTASLEPSNILSDASSYASRVSRAGMDYFLSSQGQQYITTELSFKDINFSESWQGIKDTVNALGTLEGMQGVARSLKEKWSYWAGEGVKKDVGGYGILSAAYSTGRSLLRTVTEGTSLLLDVTDGPDLSGSLLEKLSEGTKPLQTWGASWFSPNAWGKWYHTVFVKETEK